MEQRTPDEVLGLIADEDVEVVDVRFCDLPGLMQHFSIPACAADDRRVRRGPRLRRVVDPRVPGDPGIGHDPDPRLRHRVHRPLPHPQDAGDQRLRPRPADRRVLQPRPALRRAQGGRAPAVHRPGRHLLHRARGRVLHLRRRALPPGRQLVEPPGRLGRGRLEHGPRRAAQPRLQDPLQGGLLPPPARRPLPGPAHRDDAGARAGRHRGRAAAPRGRHRRAGRDRRALRRAHPHGRQADAVQVRREERRPPVRQDRHVHAQARVPGQRVGHARAPVAVEGRRAAVLRRGGVRRACPTWAAGTSAAC